MSLHSLTLISYLSPSRLGHFPDVEYLEFIPTLHGVVPSCCHVPHACREWCVIVLHGRRWSRRGHVRPAVEPVSCPARFEGILALIGGLPEGPAHVNTGGGWLILLADVSSLKRACCYLCLLVFICVCVFGCVCDCVILRFATSSLPSTL